RFKIPHYFCLAAYSSEGCSCYGNYVDRDYWPKQELAVLGSLICAVPAISITDAEVIQYLVRLKPGNFWPRRLRISASPDDDQQVAKVPCTKWRACPYRSQIDIRISRHLKQRRNHKEKVQ